MDDTLWVHLQAVHKRDHPKLHAKPTLSKNQKRWQDFVKDARLDWLADLV